MVARIKTYQTIEDFEAVAKRIISANSHNKGLMQEATIAMLEHLEKHGNINIAKPLYLASLSFATNLQKAWRYYVTGYSWLVFNAKDLRGQAILKAEFTELWTKSAAPSAKMDLDGARGAKWYDAKAPAAVGDTEYNAPDAVKRFFDRAIKALIAQHAKGADGKVITQATMRKMITEQLARMDDEVTKGLKDKVQVSANAPAPVQRTAIAGGKNVKPKAQRAPKATPERAAA